MSLNLNSVFSEKINLYDELEIPVTEGPELVPSSLIKKQYRKLALLYHPDKRPDDPGAIHKFHMLSLATHVLTDEALRATYDEWLQRTLLDGSKVDEQRNELITKLSKLESKARKDETAGQARDLTKIQEYGAMLRKMKHFRIPYGDWRTLNPAALAAEHRTDKHRFYDSSTLRIELRNDLLDAKLSEKSVLCRILSDLFQVKRLYDLFYSSRNDYEHDKSIVAYAVFETTTDSKQVYETWKASPRSPHWGELVLDISPRIPVSYYKNYEKEVELDQHIADLVANSTIVID
ncbi:hypothetical protein HG536_0B01100 [Torulaspora globosa]|uniref:J domain-containing protein n=1 Tax=Torulaspora globosa TaxID=48254 RepID=A0A7G3ZCL3_9SACH|nr:uncharacterized protein HG536_0B01100 [Torulaspora globosa]QLL31249.1 hypothetical protein HG536_0B01100 [Torulaspora globosa]